MTHWPTWLLVRAIAFQVVHEIGWLWLQVWIVAIRIPLL